MLKIHKMMTAMALVMAAPAMAQDEAEVTITPQPVAPGIAVLFGQGGNIGVTYGKDGTVLIDDQFAPLSEKIAAAVKQLGADPVKFLINTHWHGDHAGGNANFGKAGAIIVAQEHVRERLAAGATSGIAQAKPAEPVALPVITYDRGIKLHLNSDTIDVVHVDHAHTDGDSVLFWQKANVVHMGDTFFNKVTLPFIDLDSGGSAKGALAAVETVLARIDDKTVVIPGHGPVSDKAGLTAYRAMLADVIGQVETARAAGKTLEQVVAMKPAAKYDTNPEAFIKGDAFVTTVFNSLANPPHDEGEAHPH